MAAVPVGEADPAIRRYPEAGRIGAAMRDPVEVTAGGCRVIPRTTKELIVL